MRVQEENALLRQIAQRAEVMLAKHGTKIAWPFIESELRIVHREICELRLVELMAADEGNFAHDIVGIHDHIDILDGSFRNGFSPRFAKA
jgi:hypothetical protein